MMPKKLLLCCALIVCFNMFTAGSAAELQPNSAPTTVIMIMLDGFRPDYLTLYNPPNLMRLMAEGAWVVEGRSVFPSMTTANQTSFVTGALPKNTGIPNNSRYDRALDRIISPLRDNKVPTIAEIVGTQGWETISINQFMLENRGVLRYFKGNMSTVSSLLSTTKNRILVYYNGETDAVGHTYGPFSSQMRAGVLAADAEIGRLLEALQQKGLYDKTTIVVASDHGMSPTDGLPIKPDLIQLAVQSGIRIALDNAYINEDTELVAYTSGSVYLYWREGKRTPAREAELLALLRRIDGADIYTAEDIERLGADPERLGDIVIVPQAGRSLTLGSGTTGSHGTPQESHSTILFWGQRIKPGAIVHRASIIDIVPTLLYLLDLEIPATVDGEPLYRIIDKN